MRIIARMNIGGPAVQVSGLLRGFDNDIFEQRLYTGYCETGEADYLETVATDISVNRIQGLGRRINLVDDFKAFISLVLEIRRFKPHIIHTHTAKAGALGRLASVVSLHPSIRLHTFHGHLLQGYFGKNKRTLVILIERILAFITHQLLAVGDKVRQDLLQVGIGDSSKFGVMPPGLEIGPLASKDSSRELLGLPHGNLICSYIGRVTQIKRPDRFLDVVNICVDRKLPIDFSIAGDGELLDECRQRITNELLPVTVLGWQSDIERVLSASDIVILTSDNEGTPLSLIQAGMTGLPVVTTNVGSIPEVVLNGQTGLITDLEIIHIADALELLVTDGVLRNRLGSAAREFTLSKFGVKRLVSEHENLYLKLLEHSK